MNRFERLTSVTHGCLICLLFAFSVHAQAQQAAPVPCRMSDFHITTLDEEDPRCEGCGTGAGQYGEVAMIQNVSTRTCVLHGYRSIQFATRYQDYHGKQHRYKHRQRIVDTIGSSAQTLRPHDALFFRFGYSPIAASDENPIIDDVILVFDGVSGHYDFGGPGVSSGYAYFDKLSRTSP